MTGTKVKTFFLKAQKKQIGILKYVTICDKQQVSYVDIIETDVSRLISN